MMQAYLLFLESPNMPPLPPKQEAQISDRVMIKVLHELGLVWKEEKRWPRRQMPAKHSSSFYFDNILDLTELLKTFLYPVVGGQHKTNSMPSLEVLYLIKFNKDIYLFIHLFIIFYPTGPLCAYMASKFTFLWHFCVYEHIYLYV